MKRLTALTALVLFSIFYGASSASAAVDNIEIDLKDLRTPPAYPAKSRHNASRKPQQPISKSDETAPRNGASNYVVKSGDYLFVILMRHYGLSNDAAERMIPEVMRVNGISNPKGLTVGQRLTIPLTPSQDVKQRTISKKPPKAGLSQSQPSGAPQQSAQTSHSQIPAESMEQKATISVAPPCVLARKVIEHLGLLAAQIELQPESGFAAATSDIKLVVACDLPPEESYTYGRLLDLRHIRLLVFKGDESPNRVIEELADHLKLSFHRDNSTPPDILPLTYVFTANSSYKQDVSLTITAATGGIASD
ncbi:MAG: LysM domain-containing protein [Desulfuromonadales bacterium]